MGLELVGHEDQLLRLARIKRGSHENTGWGSELHLKFGHYTPDDYYESCVESLVDHRTEWIDVGGGKTIFPSNPRLAKLLVERCRRLVAVDPSTNVRGNCFAHERYQTLLEDHHDSQGFNLATMRMVVEHVENPQKFVKKLGELVRPGGMAIVHTVNRWAPVTVISAATPMWFHHAAKKVLWSASEEDTFPVKYLMNSRSQLRTVFTRAGFREVYFRYLDDCRTLARWKTTLATELIFCKALRSVGLHYPETCLLGVYERT